MATPTLGERLRERRKSLGLTLAEVRDRSGLSLPYISNLERDHGNPTLEALASLAKALATSVGELTGGVHPADGVTDTMPASLQTFAKSDEFNHQAQLLAKKQRVEIDDMKARLVGAMRAAPRRSSGEPTHQDWQRLLDVYRLILDEPKTE